MGEGGVMDDSCPLENQAFMSVVTEAAHRFAVTVDAVLGRGRTKSVVAARQWAMCECRARYSWSYPELGRVFKRDHATVMHAVRRARTLSVLSAVDSHATAISEAAE